MSWDFRFATFADISMPISIKCNKNDRTINHGRDENRSIQIEDKIPLLGNIDCSIPFLLRRAGIATIRPGILAP